MGRNFGLQTVLIETTSRSGRHRRMMDAVYLGMTGFGIAVAVTLLVVLL